MTTDLSENERRPDRSSRSRRAILAGITTAASVAVAGCQNLPWDDDDSTASYTSDEASQVLESERPEIEWPVPVEPEPSELEDALERADSLVSEIPDPLEEGHVPNGVIREAIAEDRTEAMAAREEAVDAAGPAQYHALRDARELHETARAAATAWLAIDADRDDLLRELRDERDAVQSVIDDHREALAYHGIDTDSGRLRAALYTYQRESDLERADRTVDRWSVHKSNDVLEIGESAGDLEFATTTTRIWEHFEDQYTREFGGDDSDDLEAVFERALERSSARAEEAAFPSQDGDSAEWYDAVGLEEFDHRPLEFVVSRAGSSVHRAHDRMDDALDTGSLGSGLHHALEFEQRLRGFERFRDWLAARDGAGPTDSDEIRAERDATLEAADAALEAVPANEPSLGAYRLAETLQELAWADDTIARDADREPNNNVRLDEEFGEYARLRAELEALPEAVDAFRDRLLE
ncbi:transposase [Natronolimnobius baerhuensis]|uniref:Uncharacterized protein n=1 Tax=Natronolimnobius baerhuensis TaxID=253108 RepID=A0A202EDK7_9EURY|nr:transposase [Natronolimnobius baerhuensis]OVE86309.1 hypothetical protein B2G88_05885 [Natronolimnobius baerhuensis]